MENPRGGVLSRKTASELYTHGAVQGASPSGSPLAGGQRPLFIGFCAGPLASAFPGHRPPDVTSSEAWFLPLHIFCKILTQCPVLVLAFPSCPAQLLPISNVPEPRQLSLSAV